MKGSYHIPSSKIAGFVEEILIIENYDVKHVYSLPLFANGKPTLLFQTSKGAINNSSNHLTLFGQTVFPEEIVFTDNFTLIAYFFKPYTLTTLFGFSAWELTDNPIALNLLAPQQTNELQDKLLNAASTGEMMSLLDHFIYSLITKVKTDNKLIRCATRLISESPSKEILTKVKEELFITERTLQRKFKQQVGVSPNQYRRIAQFDAAFQRLNRGRFKRLTDLAFANNYADQSHFTRTFKEFTNMTPKEYLNMGVR